MSAPAPSTGEIRDYLLRRMTEGGRSRFEEAYFADDALLDRIEAEEDVLVSDYVLGKLSDADRRLFEESLLGAPYYQERVETTSRLNLQLQGHRSFARLPRTAAGSAGKASPRTAAAVAFSVLTLLLVAALASALRLKSDLARANARIAATPPPATRTHAAPAPMPELVAVVFDPPTLQGPQFVRVTRPAGVPLLLTFSRWLVPDTGRRVRLVLLDGDRSVFESGLRGGPEDGDLAVRLPANVPTAGRYGVALRAEGAGSGGAERFLGVLEIREGPG